MAGEITKWMIGQILTELGDEDLKIVGNKGLICNKLNRYQILFMQTKFTSKRRYDIVLTAGTYEYKLHPRILKVLKSSIPNCDIQLNSEDVRNYSLIIPENAEFTTGDVLKIETFIRPLQKSYEVEEGSRIPSDIISFTVDPIIEEDYHYCLIDAVLSEYRKVNPEFKTLKDVLFIVEEIRNKTLGINNLGTSGLSNAIRKSQMRF